MIAEFESVRLLENVTVRRGERWIYIADFNIKHNGTDLRSTDRIDSEIEDLKQISAAGGVTAILAHRGRFADGDAENLDFVVPYLSEALGLEVKYCRENTGQTAIGFADSLEPGDIAVMGNTRKHEGEED